MLDIQIVRLSWKERNFVCDSWLKSYYESDFAKNINKSLYFDCHKKVIANILDRPTATTLVAMEVSEPSEIVYGFMTYEKTDKNLLHYVYVKRAFNKQGIMLKLFEKLPFAFGSDTVYASHMTHKGRGLIERFKLIYCPYFI